VNLCVNDYVKIPLLGLKNIPKSYNYSNRGSNPYHVNAFMLVEIDAPEIAYGGILKQK